MHYKFKTKPFAHQLKALEMSWDKKVFAYFMEMGTGKSKVEFNDKEKKTWKYEYRYEKPTSNKYRLNKINFSKEKVINFETDPPRREDLSKKIPYNKEDYFGDVFFFNIQNYRS